MNPKHDYGTEGPLGFPMPDKQARNLDTLLKSLPKGEEFKYRRRVKAQAPTQVNDGERSDVSWITTEALDRSNEVVLSKGMNDSQFQGNPLVTLNHSYFLPPVGRSLWRKRIKDGDTVGIMAKTQYPPMPTTWPQTEPWPPDKAFGLVQSGLLNGKSLGFLPLKVHFPDAKEAAKNSWPADALVIDEWLMLEYAAVFMPCNAEALTLAVSKSGPIPPWLAQAIELTLPATDPQPAIPPLPSSIPYTSWPEVERIIKDRISRLDLAKIAEKAVADALDLARGRV